MESICDRRRRQVAAAMEMAVAKLADGAQARHQIFTESIWTRPGGGSRPTIRWSSPRSVVCVLRGFKTSGAGRAPRMPALRSARGCRQFASG
jgi:hypothetical protein